PPLGHPLHLRTGGVMNQHGLKVGDEVMLCSVNHRPRKTRVVGIGPKYVRVEGDRRGRYRHRDLAREDGYSHEYLLTLEDFRRREEVAGAIGQLRDMGVSLSDSARKMAPELLAA